MVAGANSGHPGLPPISLYGGAMRATSEGVVTLGPDLDVVDPVIDHRYGTDPGGSRPHRARARPSACWSRWWRSPGWPRSSASGSATRTRWPTSSTTATPPAPARWARRPTRSPWSAATAPCTASSGLYVADASIMPTITRGNINLPTAMIGVNVANQLLGAVASSTPPARPLMHTEETDHDDAHPVRRRTSSSSPERCAGSPSRPGPGDLAALGARRLGPDRAHRDGQLALRGHPDLAGAPAPGSDAWRIDTGQLLDSPELLTPDTLLIATSQSGASGEVVELLDRLGVRTDCTPGLAGRHRRRRGEPAGPAVRPPTSRC